MAALGVCALDDIVAVGVAADGRLLSALEVAADGPGSLGSRRFRSALAACLSAAGLRSEDLRDVVVAGDAGDGQFAALGRRHGGVRTQDWIGRARTTCVPIRTAQASLIRAVPGGGETAALACVRPSRDPAGSVLAPAIPRADKPPPVDWGSGVRLVLSETAEFLGWESGDPVTFLETIAVGPKGGQAASGFDCILRCDENLGMVADQSALRALIDDAIQAAPLPLDRQSPHVAVQRARQALAGGVLDAAADAVRRLSIDWRDRARASRTVLTGGLFESPEFRARVAGGRGGEYAFPFDSSLAIGAALYPFEQVQPVESLALGQCFSEQDIKKTLETCRLEYVYEPDWDRLLGRVSGILASGAMVAWFQGRCEFGGVAHAGSRSVLVDSHLKYAKENVLSLLLPGRPSGSLVLSRAPEGGSFAGRNWSATPAFLRLLEVHHSRTGSPGLFNVALAGAEAPLASTPLDAIRSAFASAAEVLVIERFVVAKDYWMLRRG